MLSSASDFQALWDTVPTDQWGAADVSLSVRLWDGRDVWLYGDTFSDRRFVHSTAITMRRSRCGVRLTVSCGGDQLLPDDSPDEIYWIETARRSWLPTRMIVTAAPMLIGRNGPWDFRRRTALSREALVEIRPNDDVVFLRWRGYVQAPPPHDDFTVIGPHHFTYGRQYHPQYRLESGLTLSTVCQNRDDALQVDEKGRIRYRDYRPIFSEEDVPR